MGEQRPAWLSEFCGDCGEAYEHCRCGGAARAEVRHLRGLLARLEWASMEGICDEDWFVCPACGRRKDSGHHDPGCWLAAELRR